MDWQDSGLGLRQGLRGLPFVASRNPLEAGVVPQVLGRD
jgi:hypothetical protein